jgi:hypothetical protein
MLWVSEGGMSRASRWIYPAASEEKEPEGAQLNDGDGIASRLELERLNMNEPGAD